MSATLWLPQNGTELLFWGDNRLSLVPLPRAYEAASAYEEGQPSVLQFTASIRLGS